MRVLRNSKIFGENSKFKISDFDVYEKAAAADFSSKKFLLLCSQQIRGGGEGRLVVVCGEGLLLHITIHKAHF